MLHIPSTIEHTSCHQSSPNFQRVNQKQQQALGLLLNLYISKSYRGGMTLWVARLTCNMEVVGPSPIKGPRCFLEKETLPLLLSTGWFQEQIRA